MKIWTQLALFYRYSPSETVDNLYPDIVALLEAKKREKELEKAKVSKLEGVHHDNKVPQHHFRPLHLNMKALVNSKLHHP